MNSLAAQIVELANAQRKTIGTAESCTGGMVGAALTSVPGCSAVFKGGIISYANSVKSSLLDVPPGMIQKYGAVSREVSKAMAKSALEALNVDIAVSVTGVAGPGGGSDEKPVGTVWLGVAIKDGDNICVKTKLFQSEREGREAIRVATVRQALGLLRDALQA